MQNSAAEFKSKHNTQNYNILSKFYIQYLNHYIQKLTSAYAYFSSTVLRYISFIWIAS